MGAGLLCSWSLLYFKFECGISTGKNHSIIGSIFSDKDFCRPEGNVGA